MFSTEYIEENAWSTISKLDGKQVNTRIAKCDAKLTALFSWIRDIFLSWNYNGSR